MPLTGYVSTEKNNIHANVIIQQDPGEKWWMLTYLTYFPPLGSMKF